MAGLRWGKLGEHMKMRITSGKRICEAYRNNRQIIKDNSFQFGFVKLYQLGC